MKLLTILALSLPCSPPRQPVEKPSAHTRGTPTGRPTGALKPGEYWWNPKLSPSGPLMVLVSVPEQVMHVYRNGILIGRSTVSTGSKGHATPGGVFTILEKKQEHYSKKYDNAPMPNMQRLTWTGIAMHSGNLPGYPASHGCIRLPFDFSQLLFTATAKGGTVVVGDGKTPVPHLAASPGLILAPKDFTPEMLRPLADNDYDWNPERSASGPITMVVSAADKAIYVYRGGTPIGRAAIEIDGTRSTWKSRLLHARRNDWPAKLPGSRPLLAQMDERDKQRPPRCCGGNLNPVTDEPGVRWKSLRHAHARHDRRRHGPARRAQPPQRRDPRDLRGSLGSQQ
jgi:hypothetical protein